MPYCPNCGKQVSITAKFCRDCGCNFKAEEVQKEQPIETTTVPKCAVHPTRNAVGICESCSNAVCDLCRTVAGGKLYCVSCFHRIVSKPVQVDDFPNKKDSMTESSPKEVVVTGKAEYIKEPYRISTLREKKLNWFQRHLNSIIELFFFIALGAPFAVGFVLFDAIDDVIHYILLGELVSGSIIFLLSIWIIHRKRRSLWWLLLPYLFLMSVAAFINFPLPSTTNLLLLLLLFLWLTPLVLDDHSKIEPVCEGCGKPYYYRGKLVRCKECNRTYFWCKCGKGRPCPFHTEKATRTAVPELVVSKTPRISIKTATAFIILALISVIAWGFIPSGSNDSPLVRMIKLLPNNVSQIEYYDVQKLRTENDLASVWNGIPISQAKTEEIEHLCIVSSASGALILFDGGYNPTDFLSENNSEPYIYNGFEVTKDTSTDYSSVIIHGINIAGSSSYLVEQCIDASTNDELSLYSNQDARDMAYLLPDGYYIYIAFPNNMTADNIFYEYFMQGFEDISMVAVGQCLSKQENNYVNTAVYEFKDEDAARTFVEYPTLNASSLWTRDGRFATMTRTSATPYIPGRSTDENVIAFVTYTDDTNGFSIPLIGGWEIDEELQKGGNWTAFIDPSGCGEVLPYYAVLKLSTQGYTSVQTYYSGVLKPLIDDYTGFNLIYKGDLIIDGIPAIKITYTYYRSGVYYSKEMAYLLIKDNSVWILTAGCSYTCWDTYASTFAFTLSEFKILD